MEPIPSSPCGYTGWARSWTQELHPTGSASHSLAPSHIRTLRGPLGKFRLLPAQNTNKSSSSSILHGNASHVPQINTVLIQICTTCAVLILNIWPADPPKQLWKWSCGLSGQRSTILHLPKHLFTNSTINLVKVIGSNSYCLQGCFCKYSFYQKH